MLYVSKFIQENECMFDSEIELHADTFRERYLQAKGSYTYIWDQRS